MRKFLAALLFAPTLVFAHGEDYQPTAQGAVDQRPLTEPERNRIYACDAAAMGLAIDRPWVSDGGLIDLDKKPHVPGEVPFNSVLNVSAGHIGGNGLPGHPAGIFPVKDAAVARYDPNPNPIREQRFSYNLPLNAALTEKPACLNKGPIGVMLTGAMLFDALDAENRDAVATELFDKCEGHPGRNGAYHYHHYSPCFDSGPPNEPSPLLGYALDGFGIYGPRGAKGHMQTNAELDECHGITSEVPDGKGGKRTVYHYVLNNEFPYSLGCYRGSPARQKAEHIALNKRMPPDLRMPAARLGISVDELQHALGPPPPDIHHAAHVLGISEDQLRDALGPPPPPR